MSIPNADVCELLDVAKRLIDKANAECRSVALPCGSRALAFAIAAGLPPQMAYTVEQTSMYTGVGEKVLRSEEKAGRLHFTMPETRVKGAVVLVDEVDRWMEAGNAK